VSLDESQNMIEVPTIDNSSSLRFSEK